MTEGQHEGSCLCGRVRVRVSGEPYVAGYCHCATCRRWHSAPVNAWAIWKGSAFEIVAGSEYVRDDYDHGEGTSRRVWCRMCGSALGNRKPKTGMMVVYAQTLPTLDFVPSLHVHYADRVIDMADGLVKYADTPAKWGGSDKKVEEPPQTAWRRSS